MEKENLRQERYKSPLTEQINDLLELHHKKGLTRGMIKEWLDGIPDVERDDAINQLELGLSDKIDQLPE